MARGTFANIRILNKMMNGKVGPQTIHVPSGDVMDFFDAAERYQKEGHGLVILAGNEYGCGSSRDWAAKGPFLQGVKAVWKGTIDHSSAWRELEDQSGFGSYYKRRKEIRH